MNERPVMRRPPPDICFCVKDDWSPPLTLTPMETGAVVTLEPPERIARFLVRYFVYFLAYFVRFAGVLAERSLRLLFLVLRRYVA
jgi:hypothetical protein